MTMLEIILLLEDHLVLNLSLPKINLLITHYTTKIVLHNCGIVSPKTNLITLALSFSKSTL